MERATAGSGGGWRGRGEWSLSLSQQLAAGLLIGVATTLATWIGLTWLDSLTPDPAGFDATSLLFLLLSVVPGLGLGWLVLRPVERRIADLAVYATALARGLPADERRAEAAGALADLTTGLNELGARLAEREQQVRELGAHASRLDAPLREAAAQEERNRLARELHDTIKQQLFSIGVTAAAAEARWEADPAGARAAVGEIRALSGEAQVEMRALLTQLRPAPVATIGLLAALREQLDALAYRAEVAVEADLRPLPEGATLAPGAEDALFRIAQEGLANIARHARARHVRASFGLEQGPARNESSVELRLRDDGLGFDPGAAGEGGMGLRNMRDRAAEIDGTLAIDSRAGRGTELIVRVPLYNAPAFEEIKEVIPVATKERALWAAATLRFVSSAASVCFMWSVIIVNTLTELPDLLALGMLGMAVGTGIAAELLARRFRQVVGDAPEWRARLDRLTAQSHLAEYLISMQIVPEMLRIIFADTRFPWLGDLLGLAALAYLWGAIWSWWALVRAEYRLTRSTERWTTRAKLVQERTAQSTAFSMSLLLLLGVAIFVPGQVAIVPSSIADIVHTGLISLLVVLAGIAAWNLAVAVVRLWQGDERRVAG
jgi:signal transduction histidine kinase